MSKIEVNCGIIKDLLPLYVDDVCSEESKEAVAVHLSECESCSDLESRLRETSVDNYFQGEQKSVLNNHTKKERRLAAKIGVITSAVLLVPIIVCLICNLAVGHSLDWFFIVLTSILVFASVTVVPMFAVEKKLFYTILSFTASLLVLLMTCCIYTSGDWFFTAAASVIFGLSVVFMPYLVRFIPFDRAGKFIGAFSANKGLLVMLWDTAWLYIMLAAIGVQGNYDGYWREAFSIATGGLLLPWAIFLVSRYSKKPAVTKVGLSFIAVAVFTEVTNDLINFLLYGKIDLMFTHADFKTWMWTEDMGEASLAASNANFNVTAMIGFIVAGLILCGIGAVWTAHKKSKIQK